MSCWQWTEYKKMVDIDTLRWMNDDNFRKQIKLRHFGIKRVHAARPWVVLSKSYSRELCQLLTSLTTHSNLKSISLHLFRIPKQQCKFLEMW